MSILLSEKEDRYYYKLNNVRAGFKDHSDDEYNYINNVSNITMKIRWIYYLEYIGWCSDYSAMIYVRD